jgi:hypothetical protein
MKRKKISKNEFKKLLLSIQNPMKRPEVKKKHFMTMNRVEVREKISKKMKLLHKDPIFKKLQSEGMKGHIVTELTKRKISEKQKGIPKSEDMKRRIKETCLVVMNKPEIKEKVSLRTTEKALRGENHPNWLGGISLEYDKNFNTKFRKLIILRDTCCLICGKNSRLQVHHIDYNKLNSTKENCCTLCCSCHSKTSFNRTQWIQFFHSLLIDKYKYFYIINKQEEQKW